MYKIKKTDYYTTLSLFLYFVYSSFVSANQFNYTFESFSTRNGLTQNTVNDIIQDKQGFIWLATFNGLNRYDGIRTVQFVRHSPDFPIFDNEITDLELADNGRMWVLSRQFIFYKDPNQPFKKFIDLNSLYLKEEARTHSRIISKSDRVILFHNQGVIEFSLKGEIIRRYPYKGKERHAWFIMKSSPHNNDELLATTNGLWVLKNKGEWYQPEYWPSFLKHGFLHTLVATPEGYIIFGLDSMHFLDKELHLVSQRTYSFSGLDTFPFRASLSSNGTLWLATFDKLYQLDMNGNFLNASTLPLAKVAHETGGNITCLFIDKHDGVWAGTSNIGAKYLNKNSQYFKTLTRNQTNNNFTFSVTSIAEDKQNNLYIGTSGGEVFSKGYQQPMQKLPLTKNNIPIKIGRTSGLIAKNNHLWIGSFTSLFHYNLKTKVIERLKISAEQFMTNVNSLTWFNDKIWGVSTYHGPFILEPVSQKIILLSQNKNWKKQWGRFHFTDLANLGEYVYMVTEHGAILKVHQDTKNMELIDALSNQKQPLYKIVADHEKLWILSDDTLYEFHPVTQMITPRLKAIDYLQTAFYSILPDGNNLWIGGSTDLIYYQVLKNKVVKFSTPDGAIRDEFNAISFKSDSKNLLFSTVSGVLKVEPSDLLPHINVNPQTQVSQITLTKVDEKSFEQSITDRPTTQTDFILEVGESLLIQLAPAQVSFADQIKLEYRTNKSAWRPVQDWSLQLAQESLKSGEQILEIRSAQQFSDDWHISHRFNLDVQSTLQIPPVYYWLITLAFLILFLIYLIRNRQLKANIAESAHLEFKQKSQEIIQEQQILRQIAEIIITEMESFYLLLRPQLIQQQRLTDSKRITGRFIKLSTQIATYQTNYLTSNQAIELKPWLEHLVNRYINFPEKSDGQYLLELNDISSKVSKHFLKHHLALIGLLLESSHIKSMKIILSKSSARRATLSFHSQLSNQQAPDFATNAQLFSSLAQILVNCAKSLGVDSELRLTPSLLDWQLTFTATQRWRENADSQEHVTTQIDVSIEDPLTNEKLPKTELVLINLTQLVYPVNLLSTNFHITEYPTLEKALSAEIINSCVLIAVENLSLEEAQLVHQLYQASRHPIVLCYAYIRPEIQEEFAEESDILLLPFSITSPALLPVLEYIQCRNQFHSSNQTALFQSQEQSQPAATHASETSSEKVISRTNTKTFHNQTPSNSELLTKLNQYLETYCADESLDVEKIAYALHLSSRHLARKLKDLVNLSTAEYVRQYRLNKALSLLNKGYPINQVGKMTGFSSRNYFSTCFKKHFGVTPSDFRDIEQE